MDTLNVPWCISNIWWQRSPDFPCLKTELSSLMFCLQQAKEVEKTSGFSLYLSNWVMMENLGQAKQI